MPVTLSTEPSCRQRERSVGSLTLPRNGATSSGDRNGTASARSRSSVRPLPAITRPPADFRKKLLGKEGGKMRVNFERQWWVNCQRLFAGEGPVQSSRCLRFARSSTGSPCFNRARSRRWDSPRLGLGGFSNDDHWKLFSATRSGTACPVRRDSSFGRTDLLRTLVPGPLFILSKPGSENEMPLEAIFMPALSSMRRKPAGTAIAHCGPQR